jgi:hypothetical protein
MDDVKETFNCLIDRRLTSEQSEYGRSMARPREHG